jgi:hypothetical protein
VGACGLCVSELGDGVGARKFRVEVGACVGGAVVGGAGVGAVGAGVGAGVGAVGAGVGAGVSAVGAGVGVRCEGCGGSGVGVLCVVCVSVCISERLTSGLCMLLST